MDSARSSAWRFSKRLLTVPAERDLAADDRDLDLARIHVRIVRQAVVHVLADPFVRTLVALGAAPAMVLGVPHVVLTAAVGILVAEPGPDLVARPLEEASLLAVFARAAAEAVRPSRS